MVKVVIPIYRTELDRYEHCALLQCFSILRRYPIVFVKPYSLDISIFFEKYGNNFTVECFPDEYFINVKSYNHLMLSAEFYERFLDVKNILIYQTDAWVFSDKLEEWCTKGYDYVGAPWLPKIKYVVGHNRIVWYFRWALSFLSASPHSIQREYKVGNGGFSLRNTCKFYEIALEMKDTIEHYKVNCDKEAFNEDVFWGIEVNKHGKRLNIPSYKEALQFSIELNPDAGYLLNDKQLPFGTHAWQKVPFNLFWRYFIKC